MNTRLYSLLLVLLVACKAAAQEKYPNCDTKYFKNRKAVSTTTCFDKDHRQGMATAYDVHGKKIYTMPVRRCWGSASVEFRYYDDGAVKQARYHSYPDGGIQWYSKTTDFAPDGTIAKEDEEDYDGHPRVTIQQPPTTTPPKPKKEIVRCAVPFATEYWYVNTTHYPAIVVAERKGNPKDIKAVVVLSGDTVKGGEFIMAEQFVKLSDYYDYSVQPVRDDTRRKLRLEFSPASITDNKTGRKRCYYIVK